RARQNGRQREERTEEPEDDPEDRDVAGGEDLAEALDARRADRCGRHLPPLARLYTDITSKSAPTNSTTRPCIIHVRLPASCGSKTLGSSWRLEVPTVSAPKSSAAKKTPIGELRPSSATAIPRKPTFEMRMSDVAMWNSQPSTSIAPPRPANAPEI